MFSFSHLWTVSSLMLIVLGLDQRVVDKNTWFVEYPANSEEWVKAEVSSPPKQKPFLRILGQ